jgi:hypothetical protein
MAIRGENGEATGTTRCLTRPKISHRHGNAPTGE